MQLNLHRMMRRLLQVACLFCTVSLMQGCQQLALTRLVSCQLNLSLVEWTELEMIPAAPAGQLFDMEIPPWVAGIRCRY